jgi:hypothetical protein
MAVVTIHRLLVYYFWVETPSRAVLEVAVVSPGAELVAAGAEHPLKHHLYTGPSFELYY